MEELIELADSVDLEETYEWIATYYLPQFHSGSKHKLIDNQEERLKPIAEVRDAIYQIFYEKEVNKRYSAWIKKLKDKAYTKIIF